MTKWDDRTDLEKLQAAEARIEAEFEVQGRSWPAAPARTEADDVYPAVTFNDKLDAFKRADQAVLDAMAKIPEGKLRLMADHGTETVAAACCAELARRGLKS